MWICEDEDVTSNNEVQQTNNPRPVPPGALRVWRRPACLIPARTGVNTIIHDNKGREMDMEGGEGSLMVTCSIWDTFAVRGGGEGKR